MTHTIGLIRSPYLSRYNQLDVREEPILSSAAAALLTAGADIKIFDFHLDRTITLASIAESELKTFIIPVRGTGLHWKYARQITGLLLEKTKANIVVYGQVGKIAFWASQQSARVKVIPHDERQLLISLQLTPNSEPFGKGNTLQHFHYASLIWDQIDAARKDMFKPTIESTRGCHFGCTFCFINQGVNYPERFARQALGRLEADIEHYNSFGHHDFWLYDSEFIGGKSRDFPNVDAVLDTLRDSGSDKNSFMIYNRSDTLNKYGKFEKLKESGISTVLMGVESFDEKDLRAFKKGGKPSIALDTIQNLLENEIFCNLNFILFNRSSTLKSIRTNLNAMIELYSSPKFGFLGPTFYFSYSFESDWSEPSVSRSLSNKTMLFQATGNTTTPKKLVAFDPMLEPLAEFYRILNYEHISKICELNLAKHSFSPDDLQRFHEWATLVNLFILNRMDQALTAFEQGLLTMQNIYVHVEDMYADFDYFNQAYMPPQYAITSTSLNENVGLDWNGWDPIIPFERVIT